MNTKYITCDNYCKRVGMDCLNAYEEKSGSCVVEKQHTCDAIVHGTLNKPTTDVICECKPGNKNGKPICNQCWKL